MGDFACSAALCRAGNGSALPKGGHQPGVNLGGNPSSVNPAIYEFTAVQHQKNDIKKKDKGHGALSSLDVIA